MDLKQTVSEMRRSSILEGAEKVFCERGYYKATTKMVAKAAGVGEGTIYNYFKNKHQLLLALLEKIVMEPIKKIMLENPPDDPRYFLNLIIENRSQFVRKYGSLLASLLTEISKNPQLMKEFYHKIIKPVSDLLENYLEKQKTSGQFRAINPLIISNAIIGAIWLNSAFKESSLDNRYDDISQEKLTEELIDWIIGGLNPVPVNPKVKLQ
jgi:AcrR family transcriptional regulator